MGSWRKVGAFLGLVPDDGRRDEYDPEYDEQRDFQDDDQDGYSDRRDIRRSYAADDYGPGEYERETRATSPGPARRGG